MALVIFAVVWLVVGVFVLRAPDSLLTATPRGRRYAAAGCAVFAIFCLIGAFAA